MKILRLIILFSFIHVAFCSDSEESDEGCDIENMVLKSRVIFGFTERPKEENFEKIIDTILGDRTEFNPQTNTNVLSKLKFFKSYILINESFHNNNFYKEIMNRLSDVYIKRRNIETKDNDKLFNDFYDNLKDCEINKTLDFLKIHDFSYFDIFEKYKEHKNFKDKDFNFVEELKKIIIFIYSNRWIINDLDSLKNIFNRFNFLNFILALKKNNGCKKTEYILIAQIFQEHTASYYLDMDEVARILNNDKFFKKQLLKHFFTENKIDKDKYFSICEDFFYSHIFYNDKKKIGEELLRQIKLNESDGNPDNKAEKNISIFCAKNCFNLFCEKNNIKMDKNKIEDHQLVRCYELCLSNKVNFEIFLEKIKSLINTDYRNFFEDITVVSIISSLFPKLQQGKFFSELKKYFIENFESIDIKAIDQFIKEDFGFSDEENAFIVKQGIFNIFSKKDFKRLLNAKKNNITDIFYYFTKDTEKFTVLSPILESLENLFSVNNRGNLLEQMDAKIFENYYKEKIKNVNFINLFEILVGIPNKNILLFYRENFWFYLFVKDYCKWNDKDIINYINKNFEKPEKNRINFYNNIYINITDSNHKKILLKEAFAQFYPEENNQKKDKLFNSKEGIDEKLKKLGILVNKKKQDQSNLETNFQRIPLEKKTLTEFFKLYVVGQDEIIEKFVDTLIYNLSLRENGETQKKKHTFFVGHSGSGKTFLAELAAKLLGIPFYIIDSSSLTAQGYVGNSFTDFILKARTDSVAKGNCMKGLFGADIFDAIFVLDELDKNGKNSKDLAVKSNVLDELLNIVGGGTVSITGKQNSEQIKIDCSNFIFFATGAFSKQIEKAKSENREIKLSDIIDNGGMGKELIGRFGNISFLNSLSKKEYFEVLIKSIETPLLLSKKIIKARLFINADFDKDALDLIAGIAEKKSLGVRGLQTLVGEITDAFINVYQRTTEDFEPADESDLLSVNYTIGLDFVSQNLQDDSDQSTKNIKRLLDNFSNEGSINSLMQKIEQNVVGQNEVVNKIIKLFSNHFSLVQDYQSNLVSQKNSENFSFKNNDFANKILFLNMCKHDSSNIVDLISENFGIEKFYIDLFQKEKEKNISNIITDTAHKAFEKSQKNGLLASQSIFVFDGLEHVMKNLGSYEDNQMKVMQIFESIHNMSGKKYKIDSDEEIDHFKSIFFLQNVMFILVGDLDYLGNYSNIHYDRISKFVNNRIDKQDRTIDDYKKYFVKSEKLKAYLRQLKNKTKIDFEISDGAIDWICKIAFNNRKTLDTIMMDKLIVQLGEKLLEDYGNYKPEKDQENLLIDHNYLQDMDFKKFFSSLSIYNYHL